MPGSLKTEGIVLRSLRYGEADRILHLYTPDRGRIGAIAKGVRRAKSRFGGRLEPFFRLDLVLYQGRSDLHDGDERRDAGGLPAAARGRRRARRRRPRLRGGRAGVRRRRSAPRRLPPARQRARAARPRARAGGPRQRARVPAQAAAGRGLRAAARRLRLVRRGGAPRGLLGRRRRRGLRGVRGKRFPAGTGGARLPRRRPRHARSPRYPMRRRARWHRPSGRYWRRSSTTAVSGCGLRAPAEAPLRLRTVDQR